MKLEITEDLTSDEKSKLWSIYNVSFPDAERKPEALILYHKTVGLAKIYGLKADGKLVGLLITIEGKRHLLIDYLAIDPEKRDGGYGSKFLKTFLNMDHSNRPVCLEIEDPDMENPAPEAARRRDFKADRSV